MKPFWERKIRISLSLSAVSHESPQIMEIKNQLLDQLLFDILENWRFHFNVQCYMKLLMPVLHLSARQEAVILT